jgi:tetratricopeptide (TPR) repeat protein
MIDPLKLSHYIDAGDLLFEMKDYDKALAFYQSALDLDSDIYVLSRLGETSCENKNYKDAIRYLEEVRKTDENFRQITVVNLLYHAYRESGDLKKAGQFYKANENILADKTNSENKKEIFARVPDEVKTYIDQAFLSLKSNQPEQATELLLKANQISETAIANRLLGEIFFRKQKKEALYYLKKGYSEYKSDPQYLNTLCYACVYFKDYNYAGKILPELKQLDPGNPNIETFEKIISRAKKSD